MLNITERDYYGNPRYCDFDQFFPVLLATLGQAHPPPATRPRASWLSA